MDGGNPLGNLTQHSARLTAPGLTTSRTSSLHSLLASKNKAASPFAIAASIIWKPILPDCIFIISVPLFHQKAWGSPRRWAKSSPCLFGGNHILQHWPPWMSRGNGTILKKIGFLHFLTFIVKTRKTLLSWTSFLKAAVFYMLSSSLFGLILFFLLSSELFPAVPHLELSCS